MLSGRKGRLWSGARPGPVALALIAILACAGCGASSSSGPATASTASGSGAASAVAPRRARRARRARAKARGGPQRHAASACAAPTDVLRGVYHPYRLRVLAPCRAVSGTVIAVSHEVDGDVHIDLDTGGALTNAVNRSVQGGGLVVEFMPRDGGHLPAPTVGERIGLTGAWVLDTNHGWNELHPVWSETRSGVTYRSGPRYGGSPADVGSSEAASECVSNGATCRGYGEGASAVSRGRPRSRSHPPASHLRGGEFCSTSEEAFYEANGYTCSPASDGRERLHRR